MRQVPVMPRKPDSSFTRSPWGAKREITGLPLSLSSALSLPVARIPQTIK